MAYSGLQVTRPGNYGGPRPPYGSFAGKAQTEAPSDAVILNTLSISGRQAARAAKGIQPAHAVTGRQPSQSGTGIV